MKNRQYLPIMFSRKNKIQTIPTTEISKVKSEGNERTITLRLLRSYGLQPIGQTAGTQKVWRKLLNRPEYHTVQFCALLIRICSLRLIVTVIRC